MASHVFVIATWEGCHHCKIFKERHYNSLIEKLSEIGTLSVILYELDKNRKLTAKYIKAADKSRIINPNFISIPSIIPWYPAFLLFKKEVWENVAVVPIGSIYNGIRNSEGLIEPASGGSPITADKIFEFVVSSQGRSSSHVDILRNRGHGFATPPVKITYRSSDIDED